MTWRPRAHYDGEKLVLEEPVDLGVAVPLRLVISPASDVTGASELLVDNRTEDEWLAALEHLISLAVPGVNIPDEALRRENMYGDDGR